MSMTPFFRGGWLASYPFAWRLGYGALSYATQKRRVVVSTMNSAAMIGKASLRALESSLTALTGFQVTVLPSP